MVLLIELSLSCHLVLFGYLYDDLYLFILFIFFIMLKLINSLICLSFRIACLSSIYIIHFTFVPPIAFYMGDSPIWFAPSSLSALVPLY